MQRLALSLYIGKHADYLIHIYVYISRCCRIMNHFHLGRDRYVTVRTFQDKEYVHIRCFKEYPNNPKLYPIAKGIALPLERFKTLCESVNVIEEWYTNQRCLFSYCGNVYVTPSANAVDIRQHFLPEDTLVPTKKGIRLTITEWGELKLIAQNIDDFIPQLASVLTCYQRNDHCNQEGAYACTECHPNGPDFQTRIY